MNEITGHDQVLRMLSELETKTEKAIFRKGLRAAAKIILPVVKSLAAKHNKSGKMLANLKVRSGGGGKGMVALKIGASKKDFVGPAFYTVPVLFGHHLGKRPTTRAGRAALKKHDSRRFIPGDDFIDKAQQQTQGAAVTAMTDTMLQEIGKITKQG